MRLNTSDTAVHQEGVGTNDDAAHSGTPQCTGCQSRDWRSCGAYTIYADSCPRCGGATRSNHHGLWCATCAWSLRTDIPLIIAQLMVIVGAFEHWLDHA